MIIDFSGILGCLRVQSSNFQQFPIQQLYSAQQFPAIFNSTAVFSNCRSTSVHRGSCIIHLQQQIYFIPMYLKLYSCSTFQKFLRSIFHIQLQVDRVSDPYVLCKNYSRGDNKYTVIYSNNSVCQSVSQIMNLSFYKQIHASGLLQSTLTFSLPLFILVHNPFCLVISKTNQKSVKKIYENQ